MWKLGKLFIVSTRCEKSTNAEKKLKHWYNCAKKITKAICKSKKLKLHCTWLQNTKTYPILQTSPNFTWIAFRKTNPKANEWLRSRANFQIQNLNKLFKLCSRVAISQSRNFSIFMWWYRFHCHGTILVKIIFPLPFIIRYNILLDQF